MSEFPGETMRAVPNARANVTGVMLMLIATGCSTSMHGVVRFLSPEIPTFEMVFFRHFFGLLVLGPWIVVWGIGTIRTRQLRVHALRALIGVVGIAAWFYGLSLVPLAEATALNFLSSIFTGIGAVVIYGEIMRRERWIAVAIGFAGVLVILRPGFEVISLGAVIVILSSLLWSASLLLLKQVVRADRVVATVAIMYMFMAGYSLAPAMFDWRWPGGDQLALLALMAAVGTIGHLALAQAFRIADATVVMPVDFARLIWAAAIGYLLFAELPDFWTWVGGAVIFCAGALLGLSETMRRPRKVGSV